jgi:ribosome maturation factor RimP
MYWDKFQEGRLKKQELIAYVEKIASDLCSQNGYDLWDVDYVKEGPDWYLKVFCDKEGGFSINDCVLMSHALEEIIDKGDPIDNPYVLEVSSPGLDRPLKKDKDFLRSLGKIVDVKTFQPQGDAGKSFQALLKGYDPQTQTLSLELEDGRPLTLTKKDLSAVNLAVIF